MQSLLSQSYPLWECLIIDDGSTDGSRDYLASLRDPRIRVTYHVANQGLSRSLNEAIDGARGEFIARMDQDDVNLPDRFRLQVRHLERHPSHQVVGGQILQEVDGRKWKYPTSPTSITCRCAFGAPFAHPTVMMRKGIARYRPEFDYAEDWDLWDRLSVQGVKWANLDAPVLRYRQTLEGMSRAGRPQQRRARELVSRNILGRLGIPVDPCAVDTHLALTQADKNSNIKTYHSLIFFMWLQNTKKKKYPEFSFLMECAYRTLMVFRGGCRFPL